LTNADGVTQRLIKARGLEETWDRIGDISAAITTIADSNTSVRRALRGEYHGSNHTKPDTRSLGWKAADAVHNTGIDHFEPNRMCKNKVVKDVLLVGQEKLPLSLRTFNKHLRTYQIARGGQRRRAMPSDGNEPQAEDNNSGDESSEDEMGTPDFGEGEELDDEMDSHDLD
jgi:hypothetical protein